MLSSSGMQFILQKHIKCGTSVMLVPSFLDHYVRQQAGMHSRGESHSVPACNLFGVLFVVTQVTCQ